MAIPSNKYVALDIGSSAISAMAAEILDSGEINILAVETVLAEVAHYGIVDNNSVASYNVVKLAKLLKNSSKLPVINQVAVSVNAKSLRNQVVTINRFMKKDKPVTDDLLIELHKEAEKKVTGTDIHIFDVIPLSYTLDEVRMDDPVGKSGVHLTATYNAIYGKALINEKLEGVFDRNDIYCIYKPIAIEALSEVLLTESERESGCVLMSFGATTTSVGIYHEGVLQHLLVIPLGGRSITQDISELGINLTNAEKLKCLKGCALSSLVNNPVYIQVKSIDPDAEPVKISTLFLSEIIEARLEEMLHPAFKLIDEIKFPVPAGIIITGGASRLSYLSEFLEEKTGLKVRTGNHNKFLSPNQQTVFSDPGYSQLLGTIKLTHQYFIDNPPEENKKRTKEQKKPKRGIKTAITDIFIDFFKDENSMDDDGKDTEKNKSSEQPENNE